MNIVPNVYSNKALTPLKKYSHLQILLSLKINSCTCFPLIKTNWKCPNSGHKNSAEGLKDYLQKYRVDLIKHRKILNLILLLKYFIRQFWDLGIIEEKPLFEDKGNYFCKDQSASLDFKLFNEQMLDKIAEEDEAEFDDNIQHQMLLLQTKYAKMDMVQLKKQRMKSIKELKEIHELLNSYLHKNTDQLHKKQDNLIQGQSVEIGQQLKYIQKRRKNLQKSLDNFQFMLTQEYNQKLHEELAEGRAVVRKLKLEVGLLKRQMDLPMKKQIEFCEQLQKQQYKLESQVQKTISKNKGKKQRLKQIEEQIQEKKLKRSRMEQSRMQKKEMEIELADLTQKNMLRQKSGMLREQKKKLELKISEIIKKGKYKLNKLKKDQITLEDTGLQHEKLSLQMDQKIDETNQEIKIRKAQIRRIKAKKRNRNRIFSRNRFETEPENFSIKKSRVETIDYHSINNNRHKKNRSSSVFAPENSSYKKYTTPFKPMTQKFPNIYEYLGKNKLLLQDQCDIADLVYQGSQ